MNISQLSEQLKKQAHKLGGREKSKSPFVKSRDTFKEFEDAKIEDCHIFDENKSVEDDENSVLEGDK